MQNTFLLTAVAITEVTNALPDFKEEIFKEGGRRSKNEGGGKREKGGVGHWPPHINIWYGSQKYMVFTFMKFIFKKLVALLTISS